MDQCSKGFAEEAIEASFEVRGHVVKDSSKTEAGSTECMHSVL